MTFLKHEVIRIWLGYAGIATVILLPMLLPGYILTLDLVFTPHFALPTEVTNSYPLQISLWLLHFILPGDVIEKIILFSILLLSGVGIHLLVRSIRTRTMSVDYWNVASWFAGILYTVNPFTYARFMAGQWMVLLGYALLPFFIRFLFQLMWQPGKKQAVKVIIAALAISAVSIHHIGMLVFTAAIISAAAIGIYRGSERVRRVTYLAIVAIGYLAGSLYWLIGVFLGTSSVSKAVALFGQSQFHAFETLGGNTIGQIAEVVRLQGFWAEARHLFALPQSIIPLWGVVFLLLWVVVFIGMKLAWRRHTTIILFSIACILGGIILAATPLVFWLSTTVPFVAGYREPHKFVNLIIIGYGLLGALGVAYGLNALHRRSWFKTARGFAGLVLLLPVVITPVMFWGFAGQLQPRQYPSQWSAANDYLITHAPNERVLFLPWHQYARYSFSGRLIANPAEKFFAVPAVISDDPEFNGALPTVPDALHSTLSKALQQKIPIIPTLRAHNIHYILIAKEQAYRDYDYLLQSKDIRNVYENDKLTIYKIGGAQHV